MSEIKSAIQQICEEKGLSYESVMETIETALAAAYRKDYGNKLQNIEVEFDVETGLVKAFDVKTIVEDLPEEEMERMRESQAQEAALEEAEAAGGNMQQVRAGARSPEQAEGASKNSSDATDDDELPEDDVPKFNPKTDVMISDAKVLKMNAEIGDIIRTELPVATDFGRMAAMTAKQVITQKLRESEREIIFNEYKEQEGEILIGTVQRREGRVVLIDIGRSVGILLPEDQAQNEHYQSGDRIKVFVREVSLSARGPQILLSRTSPELVRSLFLVEIPEIADGLVEIKGIAREAGHRTKIAVTTSDESIDPIGACIGQRGVRIQTIIQELGGEKIDVIEWEDDAQDYLLNALAPAKIEEILLNEEEHEATAIVKNDQLSLAIGKGGQNVRLASRLTGWRLRIQEDGVEVVNEEKAEKVAPVEVPIEDTANEANNAEPIEDAAQIVQDESTEDEA